MTLSPNDSQSSAWQIQAFLLEKLPFLCTNTVQLYKFPFPNKVT